MRATKEALGLGSRRARSSSPTASTRRSAQPSAAQRAHAAWRERFEAWRGADAGPRRRVGRAPGPGRPLPGRRGGAAAIEWDRRQDRDPRRRRQGDGGVRALRPDDGRRRRRPRGVDEDRVPGVRDVHPARSRAQRLLRRARARHGRRRSTAWRRTAGSCARTARRSCSSPTTCAARSACRALTGLRVAWVFTHDSVGAGRGRPDAPAGRAPRRAARDPRPRRAAARRRERDRRGVARDPRGPRRARPSLALSRQDLPVLDRSRPRRPASASGAYVLVPGRRRRRSWPPARRSRSRWRRSRLAAQASRARVVSMPSVGAVRAAGRRLPRVGAARRRCRRCRVEAGVSLGWDRYADGARRDRPLRRAARRARRCSSSSAITARHVVGGRATSLAAEQLDGGLRSAAAGPPRRGPTVTWIAAGSRTQAIRLSAVRRSSMNWNARPARAPR